MNETTTIETAPTPIARDRMTARHGWPCEYKAVALRECIPTADTIDTPDKAAEYWWINVPGNPYFKSEVESMICLFINVRRKCLGHTLVTTGTLDTMFCTPREIFRCAIIANAAAILLLDVSVSQ